MLAPKDDNEEYKFYLKFAKPLVLSLPTTEERAKAAVWIKRLEQEENVGRSNEYLKALLCILQRRKLIKPFDELPPDDALPPLDSASKNFKDIHEQGLEASTASAGYLKWPRYNVSCSPTFTEYAASQEIPNFGAHVYFAISKEPVHAWDDYDKAIILPSHNVDVVNRPEWQMEPQAIPDISTFVDKENMIPKKPSSNEELLAKPKPPSKLITSPKSKKPCKSGDVEDEFSVSRSPPTWGSNLINVKDTEPRKQKQRTKFSTFQQGGDELDMLDDISEPSGYADISSIDAISDEFYSLPSHPLPANILPTSTPRPPLESIRGSPAESDKSRSSCECSAWDGEKSIGGDSTMGSQRDYKWMEKRHGRRMEPSDQDSSMWESYEWGTKDPEKILQQPFPDSMDRPLHPGEIERQRWANVEPTPPLFSKDPRIREAADRVYQPQEFGMASFEEPVWQDAKAYLKYEQYSKIVRPEPYVDPRDINRETYRKPPTPKFDLSNIQGSPRDEHFFDVQSPPAAWDFSTISSIDLEFDNEDELIFEDYKIIYEQIPATTPQRSPLPRRLSCETPPFIPDTEVEVVPSPEWKTPERHVAIPYNVDYDINIGTPTKYAPKSPKQKVVFREPGITDEYIENLQHDEEVVNTEIERAQRYHEIDETIREQYRTPPRSQTPPQPPHPYDVSLPSGLPSPMPPERLPPSNWDYETPPHLYMPERPERAPQQIPTLFGAKMKDDLFEESPPPGFYSPGMKQQRLIHARLPATVPQMSPIPQQPIQDIDLMSESPPFDMFVSPSTSPESGPSRKPLSPQPGPSRKTPSPQARPSRQPSPDLDKSEDLDEEISRLEDEIFGQTEDSGAKTPKCPGYIAKPPITPDTPEYMRRTWRLELEHHEPKFRKKRFGTGIQPPRVSPVRERFTEDLQEPVITPRKLHPQVIYPTTPSPAPPPRDTHGLPTPIRHEYRRRQQSFPASPTLHYTSTPDEPSTRTNVPIRQESQKLKLKLIFPEKDREGNVIDSPKDVSIKVIPTIGIEPQPGTSREPMASSDESSKTIIIQPKAGKSYRIKDTLKPPENWDWKTPSPLKQRVKEKPKTPFKYSDIPIERSLYAESPPQFFESPKSMTEEESCPPNCGTQTGDEAPCPSTCVPKFQLRSPMKQYTLIGEESPPQFYELPSATEDSTFSSSNYSPSELARLEREVFGEECCDEMEDTYQPYDPLAHHERRPIGAVRTPDYLDPNLLFSNTPISGQQPYEPPLLPSIQRYEYQRSKWQPYNQYSPSDRPGPSRTGRPPPDPNVRQRLQFEEDQQFEEVQQFDEILACSTETCPNIFEETPPALDVSDRSEGARFKLGPGIALIEPDDQIDTSGRAAFEDQLDTVQDTSLIDTEIPEGQEDFKWLNSCGRGTCSRRK